MGLFPTAIAATLITTGNQSVAVQRPSIHFAKMGKKLTGFGSKQNLHTVQSQAVTIGGSQVSVPDSVKCIGATLNSTLSLEKQISATCKSAGYHLHLISRTKKYLTHKQIISAIHIYVTCRLVQNNSLLICAPQEIVLNQIL